MADLPVACTLSPEALKTRREGLLSGLLGRADEQEEGRSDLYAGCMPNA